MCLRRLEDNTLSDRTLAAQALGQAWAGHFDLPSDQEKGGGWKEENHHDPQEKNYYEPEKNSREDSEKDCQEIMNSG